MLRYEVVDVFTDRPYAGNPLAVVLDAEGLSDGQMLAIAREFHLSETAFPLPSPDPSADYLLRIFTPEEEIPFAGHPSVGTAWLLAALGRVGAEVRQLCGEGVLPLSVTAEGAVLTAGTPVAGPPVDPEPVLRAVGLGLADLDAAAPARTCSAGLPATFVPVRPEAVGRAGPDVPALLPYGNVSVFSWDGGTARTRVFCASLGIPEDPATGSAAAAFGAWLAAGGLVGDGESSYVVLQGEELHRPSRIEGQVLVEGGRAVRCRIGGRVARVARGEIERPPD